MGDTSASQTGPDAGTEPSRTSNHDRIYSTAKALGAIVKVQDGGISLLGTKAKALEAVIPKLLSDEAKDTIKELLSVVSALQESREKIGHCLQPTGVHH
ncbi:unnamed protein product [Macrosiphum euphorbiae]|uniref:Uncharacterized protein n=1 Tax=Macrosiphum euphorbiae TaxID=13131 RepID=A0AAV0WUV5_9HEMI|nr:unnamed protein product [Macrosiphum euphorbiae]